MIVDDHGSVELDEGPDFVKELDVDLKACLVDSLGEISRAT